ncbi:MAG: signal peptidase II [Arcobacteraceae bacterium]
MNKYLVVLFVILIALDQYIKTIFVNGFTWESSCISLVLAYNYGVAFSMFEFLAHHLKYIQLGLLAVGAIYLYFNKDVFQEYRLAITILYAGGISNIIDRFIHGGVVDYVYWHCGFDFAIFNLADILIDIAVVLIIWQQFRNAKKQKKEKNHSAT